MSARTARTVLEIAMALVLHGCTGNGFSPGNGEASVDARADDDGGDASAAACALPDASDPCDCRIELAACNGEPCGVEPSCAMPFVLEVSPAPACVVFKSHRLAGLDGCELSDAGALCCPNAK